MDLMPEEEVALEQIIRTSHLLKDSQTMLKDGRSLFGWKCKWCEEEWTSITITVTHMIVSHPKNIERLMK